jgi:hypothetical protein
MMKLTAKDREQWSELRHGWISLAFFMVLGVTPFTVGYKAGQQWEAIAWLAALATWLAVWPWRFGLLPSYSGKTIKLIGIAVFGVHALGTFLRILRA